MPMSVSTFSSDDIKHMLPMKRASTPTEVADLVGFLASPQAAYITGQIIKLGKPQAMPGDSKSLTYAAVMRAVR